MVRIEAVIRANKLDEVKEALNEVNVPGLTVLEARGAGRMRGYEDEGPRADQAIHLHERVAVIVVVPNHMAEKMVNTIIDAAETGERGDGKIFVTPIIDVFRIRTRERGEAALSH